jgi:hypothetical protein
LNSVYKRKKSFKDNFGVSSPIKVVLEKTFTGNNGINLKEKSTFGYFVPFQSSLEKLLSIIPSTETLEFDSDQNQNKSNIFDGKYIKSKLKSKSNKKQLLFAIYCDRIEQVNAICSNRIKHKLNIANSSIYITLCFSHLSYVLLDIFKFITKYSIQFL